MLRGTKLEKLYNTKRSLKMNPNETRGQGGEEEELENKTCPTCGMDEKDWSKAQGYQQGDESYCCEGCAEGTGCICEEEPAQAKSQSSKNKRVA